MNALLAEELAAEKMRYTLDLKDKRVQESALDAEAEKVRREKTAEAAAREQVIAARGQEEAMQHVLPFKQRQIEQRRLEAEAEKVARIRGAEGSAEARQIEAVAEAQARQKLADAEAYRLEKIGKATAEQMEREGALVTRHPLLVQKALADKLSDKIQVIIAPPPADNGFIGATLLGAQSDEAARGADGAPLLALPLTAAAEATAIAIVIHDRAALRAAPRGTAPANALLWQGETLEIRGERLDYLQVYDYRRERGGFVLASELQRISPGPEEAPSSSRSCASCGACRAPKRWASASPRPTSRRRRRKCWRARSESRRSMRSGASPSASPSALRRAPRRTGPHRRSSRAISTWRALRSRLHPPRAQRPGVLLLRRRGLPQGARDADQPGSARARRPRAHPRRMHDRRAASRGAPAHGPVARRGARAGRPRRAARASA